MWGFIKKVGRAIKGAVSQAVNVLKDIAWRAAGAPDFLLTLLGINIPKRIRIRAVILSDRSTSPLIDELTVRYAIDYATSIFRREMNVKVLAAGGDLIRTQHYRAPDAALDVHCDFAAWKEDLGEAGDYFRSYLATNPISGMTGYGAPITVFIVHDVIGKTGCSLGPLADYVTVDLKGLENTDPHPDDVGIPQSRFVAHEIAHACGLAHYGSTNNLAHTSGPGTDLHNWQKAIFRNSRHVTFL